MYVCRIDCCGLIAAFLLLLLLLMVIVVVDVGGQKKKTVSKETNTSNAQCLMLAMQSVE